MRISYNTQAMKANNALDMSDNLVSRSIQRLSSGLKINAAKDSPSGYAIGKRMHMQIEGLSQATQSANDGISVISTADGALAEIQDMLQRMNELAVKASTGSLTEEDRTIIQDEAAQLKDEITRIANQTEFNGQVLMDGTYDLKAYTDDLSLKVATYSDSVPAGQYLLKELKISLDDEGRVKTADSSVKMELNGTEVNATVTKTSGNLVTIKGDNGFEMVYRIEDLKKNLTPGGSYTHTIPADGTKVDVTGFGSMKMQIGANEGQTLAIRIPKISLESMGIEDLDVSTTEGADEAISTIKDALAYVSSARSRLGAYQNRLDHTISSLNVTSENMTGAYSGIMDVDMATEMTEYTTQQVISQSATSILAQANDRPSQVLQLLQ